MTKLTYNKLVRDRIPEIIDAEGRAYETRILSDAEYQQALRDKVLEEAQEVQSAAPEALVKELADLYEVMDALMAAHGIDVETVRAKQAERREQRGGFAKKLMLLWAEASE